MPDFELNWSDPPHQTLLDDGDVHVWATTLDRTPGEISAYASTLEANERDRAARFVFDRDRNRYICGRAALRAILGSYLRTEPAQLRFSYGPRGKPALASPAHGRPLHFNVAHSDGLLLVAVTRICAVGIDVEKIGSAADADELANRFFSAREVAGLRAMPENQRSAAFFTLWTRKEACLKATGEGISESLREIEVSFLPGEPARVISIRGSSQAAERWTLKDLDPAPQFKAAVAAEATGFEFTCWRWPH